MESKELKIVPPEGYEIDKTNSTFEKIIFKKKDDKPRTWEEFCSRGFTGEEAYVTITCALQTNNRQGEYRPKDNVGYVDNIKEAKAFLALMQLRQLRNAWVGDWEPDWTEGSMEHAIGTSCGDVSVFDVRHVSKPITFPTVEMAEEFMECFKELLEQAKILL